MKGVVVCDRDEKVIKAGTKSYRLTIAIERGAGDTGEGWSKEMDLCEECAGVVARSIAQRVFLNDDVEKEIVKTIGCKEATHKKYEKSGTPTPPKRVVFVKDE